MEPASQPQSPETTSECAEASPELTALLWAAAASMAKEGELPEAPGRPTNDELRRLDPAVLREHFDDLLLSRNPEPGLDALHQMGILDVWLPEVASMVGFGDGEWRHKDVWKHTKQVVWQSVPRLEVRWGALLHDIGKPRTRSIAPNGEVHFYGHAEVGAAMFRKRIAKRLEFTGELKDRVHFLILYHLRASHYDGTWTEAAVRRFAKQMGPGLKDLLDLSRADITTKRPARKKRGLRSISELAARIREVQKQDAKVSPLPKGLGTVISDQLGVPPSKRLGEIRDQLAMLAEAGTIEGGQPVAYYVEYLRANAGDFGL